MATADIVREADPVIPVSSQPLEEPPSLKLPQDPDKVEPLNEQLTEENEDGFYTEAKESDVHDKLSHTFCKIKPVLKGTVSGMDCLEHYSEKSDISCTMNRWIYDEKPMSPTPTTESPSKLSNLPDHESQTSDIEEKTELHEDALAVPEGPSSSKEITLDFSYMLDLVKTRSVPVVVCTATLVGLSTQEKSALFQDFIKNAVKFKDTKSDLASQYHARLQKRCSKEGLSSFNFNVLGKSPFNNLMWLLGTKRSSISLSFLCCLIQSLKLRDIPIKFLRIAENEADVNEEELKQNKHGEWLFYEVTKRLKVLKNHQEKLALLTPGVTFLTVFNIGQSKAAHNFLPFLGQYCKRSLPLFFSSGEDSSNLDKPLEPESYDGCGHDTPLNHLLNAYVTKRKHIRHLMRHQSRESFEMPPILARLPSCSQSKFDNFKKIFGEYRLNPIEKGIDLSDLKGTKKILEEVVLENTSKYVTGLPLRWVFLRSLLQASNVSLMTKSGISKLATSTSCGAGIDPSEVEAFLTTFTSFASLLYIPSYTDIVLLDIERFTDCLDKVFDCGHSLDTASSFGFITEAAIDKLAEDEELDPQMFKSLLKSFRFAVPVHTSKVKSDDFFIEADHSFYIPSMRPLKATNGPQCHSLYLQYTSCVPGNIQVLLVRHFLKYSNCSLVPCPHINASVIRIHHSKEKHIDVTIIDHKDIVELRLKEPARSTEAYKTASPLVVKACTAAMEDVKKSVGDLEYDFVLCCSETESDKSNHQFIDHRIDKDAPSSTCSQCSGDTSTVLIREDWKSAVFKMHIDRDGKKEMEKGCFETSELADLAVMLSEECVDEKSQKDLLDVLQIKKKVWDSIKRKNTGSAAFLMLLMYWIENNKGSKTELEVQLKKIIFL